MLINTGSQLAEMIDTAKIDAPLAYQGTRTEDGGRRMEDGEWRTEGGGRRAEGGGWRMEDGGRRTEERGIKQECKMKDDRKVRQSV